jgi:Uncharacterized protein conserved in bacteria
MTQKKLHFISRGIVCLSVSLLISSAAPGQIHTPNLPENKWLTLAEDQFRHGNYSASVLSATTYLEQPVSGSHIKPSEYLDKAHYYRAVANLKLDSENCLDEAIAYIGKTANPSYKQRTAYAVAQYYFQHGLLDEAIPYYELAGISNLSNKEIANAKFELAYCYFNNREFDKATPLFNSIRAINSEYTIAGNYYYGLLAYNQGKYEEALTSFEKIENEKEYKAVVPYYIAEIHYFTGKRKKALEEALKLIRRSEKSYYDNELHLLAAQVLFEEQRYGDALPYFEHFYDNAEKIRKEDMYEMGYSYYRVNEWKNAIEKFKPLSNTRDSLGQTAMYLLGDCYLKTFDKKSARNAFSICADMPFNPAQQEASLLLSAKLSYEMGYYDEAMGNINGLLTMYPNTTYKDEARTILSDLLIKTSNYAEAYKTLMDVSRRSAGFGRVYQKVTYGYAMQQLMEGNHSEALKLLNSSLAYPVNPVYEAAANFWAGNAAYNTGSYSDAIDYTEKFERGTASHIAVEGLSPAATLQNAYINMGYAAMKMQNYGAAEAYFTKAGKAIGTDAGIATEAMVRSADAAMMQKNFAKAIALYDKVIEANKSDADYARYQKAIILGLQGKGNDKAAMLQLLLNRTPPSAYAGEARYELALQYIEDNKYPQAITTLQPLTEGFDARNLAPKAWMKTGFAYQQQDNNDKAIDAYKRVVVDYTTSEERPAALDALKSLYIETNQPSAYEALLKEANLTDVEDNSIDSAYYAAAEAQYASGKWEKAKDAMGKYLQQYPNGVFTSKAHYYKAESHYKLKEYKEALTSYDAVLSGSWSEFTENSARRAATISLQEKDYKTAFSYFEKLRNTAIGNENLQYAYNGLMQSSFEMGRFEQATAYADTLGTLPGMDEPTMHNILLYKAKSLQRNRREEQALTIYQQLENSTNTSIGAEARYNIAAIYLKQNKLKEAEAAAGNSIKKSAGNDYWVVKSYLLIADILTIQKDYFNAKATLQSIVKNTKIEDLKLEAGKKLDEVKELEKKQSKLSD